MVEVGVNGFGCIGCLVTRAAFYSAKVDTITINDSFTDLNYKVYTFQYESTHGKFKGIVKAENGKLDINGKPISIFQQQDCANIKWGDAGVECTVEPRGIFTTYSCIFDAWAGMTCNDHFAKTISGYDNEFGYRMGW